MLPNTAATMIQSSAVATAGTVTLMMMDGTGTLLVGVANTLETVLIAEVVKRVWVSKRCVPNSGTLLTGGVTSSDDCVSAVDIVEQFICNTVSPESQHILLPLVQTVQALLLKNVILMMSGSFTSTVHHLISPAVLVLL